MSAPDFDIDIEAEARDEAEPALEHNKSKPDAIQPGIEVKKLLKGLPPGEYAELIQQLTRGPEVTILVGKDRKRYILPKNLACYYSSFFDRAFNSGFREALEQWIHLTSCSETIFELALQWMRTGTVTLDKPKRFNKDKLDMSIEFLMYADEIQLLGPFDIVLQEIRSLLLHKTGLLSKHIQTVFQLPSGNPLRLLIAQACVKPYAWSLQLGGRYHSKRRFRFQKEMDTLDGFAADIVRAFNKAIRGQRWSIDPFTKLSFDPYEGSQLASERYRS